jgi:hypothetical protein
MLSVYNTVTRASQDYINSSGEGATFHGFLTAINEVRTSNVCVASALKVSKGIFYTLCGIATTIFFMITSLGIIPVLNLILWYACNFRVHKKLTEKYGKSIGNSIAEIAGSIAGHQGKNECSNRLTGTFEIIRIPGDGDCMIMSALMLLFTSESNTMSIGKYRQLREIVQIIRQTLRAHASEPDNSFKGQLINDVKSPISFAPLNAYTWFQIFRMGYTMDELAVIAKMFGRDLALYDDSTSTPELTLIRSDGTSVCSCRYGNSKSMKQNDLNRFLNVVEKYGCIYLHGCHARYARYNDAGNSSK